MFRLFLLLFTLQVYAETTEVKELQLGSMDDEALTIMDEESGVSEAPPEISLNNEALENKL